MLMGSEAILLDRELSLDTIDAYRFIDSAICPTAYEADNLVSIEDVDLAHVP